MYSKVSRWLHWLGAVLIALAFLLAWTREELPKGALRAMMLDWHQWVGLGVLLLLVPRVLARSHARPNPVALLPFWQRAGAVAVEGSLYATMLLQPLLGWVLAGAKGRGVSLIGIPLPRLAATDKGFAEQLGEWHETLGYIILDSHRTACPGRPVPPLLAERRGARFDAGRVGGSRAHWPRLM